MGDVNKTSAPAAPQRNPPRLEKQLQAVSKSLKSKRRDQRDQYRTQAIRQDSHRPGGEERRCAELLVGVKTEQR